MSAIERIRQKIVARDYYLSSHAEDEMAEDGLERDDIEKVILGGVIDRKLTKDPRGARYRLEGTVRDGRSACVVCRFKPNDLLIIITIYAKERTL